MGKLLYDIKAATEAYSKDTDTGLANIFKSAAYAASAAAIEALKKEISHIKFTMPAELGESIC